MDFQLQDIADLLHFVGGTPTDFQCLASAAGQMSAYEASLLLLVDSNGNVIAADDFDVGIGADVVAPLAVDLARRLQETETCRFHLSTPVGHRLALGVRMPDGHQRRILACLLRPSEALEQRFEETPVPVIVCGAFAWAAIHKRVDNAKLQRRLEHLLAEQDMLKASHTEVIDAIVREREERRQQEQENVALEELVQAAEAASRAKSQFLANASHELRTPLTAILGFADLLNADFPEDQREEYLQTIRRNGRFLLEVVNDILDLSKVEAGKMAIQRITCSPCQIVEDLVSLMRVRAQEAHLSLEVDYRFPIPETIRTDPVRLRQILVNLVGNAIKFTEQGEVRITVGFSQAPDAPSRLSFAVTDTGIGIAPDKIEQLFDLFTQADASTRRRFGGTGLGLAISDRLAAMLDGTIDVVSEPAKGSTFTVSIDPGPQQGVPMLHALPVTPHREDVPIKTAPAQPLQGRVLLAEDGKDNQRLISYIMKKVGLEVDVAENGRIACQHVSASQQQEKPYDLILMDMQMPEMDGYEATRRLRQGGWQGPIIAVTAHAMAGDREKCLQAGCDDYVSKPIEREDLLATVQRHLAGDSSTSPQAGAATDRAGS